MLFEITARILVNVPDDELPGNKYPEHQTSLVTDGLNEMFRAFKYQDRPDDTGWVVDWSYDPDPSNPSERLITARPDLSLDTYEEGEFAEDSDSAPVMLAFGDPWDGLTLVGPAYPNTVEIEEATDRHLRGATWWYVPFQSLAAFLTEQNAGRAGQTDEDDDEDDGDG